MEYIITFILVEIAIDTWRKYILWQIIIRYHDKVIIEEELNQVRMEQQEEWEMAKHNLKMAKKTLSQESLSRSDYTIRDKRSYNKIIKSYFQSTQKQNTWNIFLLL